MNNDKLYFCPGCHSMVAASELKMDYLLGSFTCPICSWSFNHNSGSDTELAILEHNTKILQTYHVEDLKFERCVTPMPAQRSYTFNPQDPENYRIGNVAKIKKVHAISANPVYKGKCAADIAGILLFSYIFLQFGLILLLFFISDLKTFGIVAGCIVALVIVVIYYVIKRCSCVSIDNKHVYIKKLPWGKEFCARREGCYIKEEVIIGRPNNSKSYDLYKIYLCFEEYGSMHQELFSKTYDREEAIETVAWLSAYLRFAENDRMVEDVLWTEGWMNKDKEMDEQR